VQGKLEPRGPPPKSNSRGKRISHSRAGKLLAKSGGATGKGDSVRRRGWGTSKNMHMPKGFVQDGESNSPEQDGLDHDDKIIAKLETKLGLDKKRKSNLGDDGLESMSRPSLMI